MIKTIQKTAVLPLDTPPLLSSHGLKSCPKCDSRNTWQIPRPFWMHFLPGMMQIQCGHCHSLFWRFQKSRNSLN
jgi:hypothetical protein